MRKAIGRVLLASPAIALVLRAAGAEAPADAAADKLDEVVVTATKTGAQSLQSTPMAISVVGGEQLLSQGVNNIRRAGAVCAECSLRSEHRVS